MRLRESFYGRLRTLIRTEDRRVTLDHHRLSRDRFAECSLELIETMQTASNYLKHADMLLDIGAFKGHFAMVANAFFNLAETVCFEPNRTLHDVIRANNPSPQVRIEDVALADTNGGEVTFYMHKDPTMNSTVDADSKVLREEFPYSDPDAIKTTRVKTITLDDYVASRNDGGRTFFLKVDTQGNELNVLRHGIRTLQRTELCLVEYIFTSPYKCNYTFCELVDFMRDNHFRCEGALSVSRRPSGKISAVDFLFVKEHEDRQSRG